MKLNPLNTAAAMALAAMVAVSTSAQDTETAGPTAIARWDVVPFQTFTDRFGVGVVAFHIDGIDRVEFAVNGGQPVAVDQMSINPRTNVMEYWIELNPRHYPDGPMTLEAFVYPRRGGVRALTGNLDTDQAKIGVFGLPLTANGGGSISQIVRFVSPTGSDVTGQGTRENPFGTIRRAARDIQEQAPTDVADGGLIYLLEGEYTLGDATSDSSIRTSSRWLSIEPAPEAAQDKVRILGTIKTGIRTKLLRLAGLTIQGPENGAAILTAWPDEDYLWLDRCRLIGAGRTTQGRWYGGWTKVFATGVEISDCANGLSAELQRDVLVHNIGSDAFSAKGLIVNCVARNIDPRGTKFHADVVQYHPFAENAIVYGLTAIDNIRAQGLFAGKDVPLRDVAFVNCHINNQTLPSHPMRVFQLGGPTHHLYLKGCSLIGPANWRTDFGFSATDVVVEATTRGKVLPFFPNPQRVEGVVYRSR